MFSRPFIKPAAVAWLAAVLLAGCSLPFATPSDSQSSDNSAGNQQLEQTQLPLEQLDKQPDLIAVRKNNQLWLVNPSKSQQALLVELKPNQVALGSQLSSTYLISPTKQWLIWYHPITGLWAVNLRDQSLHNPFPSTEWLNRNPYFEFAPNSNTVYFITDQGRVLNSLNLDDNSRVQINVPYPFGNEFRVSPDGQQILFIAGFDQSQSSNQQFMLTDLQGQQPVMFSSGNLHQRYQAGWMPDSQAVVVINNHQLLQHPVSNPQQATVLFSLADNQQSLVKLITWQDRFYLLDNAGYYHVLDAQGAELHRIPTAIASELKSPSFYPWYDNQFLITEVFAQPSRQYLRLWLSDFRGNKQMLIPEFNQIETNQQAIEF